MKNPLLRYVSGTFYLHDDARSTRAQPNYKWKADESFLTGEPNLDTLPVNHHGKYGSQPALDEETNLIGSPASCNTKCVGSLINSRFFRTASDSLEGKPSRIKLLEFSAARLRMVSGYTGARFQEDFHFQLPLRSDGCRLISQGAVN